MVEFAEKIYFLRDNKAYTFNEIIILIKYSLFLDRKKIL